MHSKPMKSSLPAVPIDIFVLYKLNGTFAKSIKSMVWNTPTSSLIRIKLSQIKLSDDGGVFRHRMINTIIKNEVSKIGILNAINKISNIMSKAKGDVGNSAKVVKSITDKKIAKLAVVASMVMQKATEVISKITPDTLDIDIDFYVREACMDIVPTKFEGTMIGLRVVHTLDSQLYGLAQTIATYIDIDPTELYDVGANMYSDIDDIISAIYDIVESEIDNMGDQESICKNFWNNRELV